MNRSQPPQTGGCPYIWMDSPSGDAEAPGAATRKRASSTATTLPARHMADMVARGARAGLHLEPNSDLAVLFCSARAL